jgi:hypothetical protein
MFQDRVLWRVLVRKAADIRVLQVADLSKGADRLTCSAARLYFMKIVISI